MFLEREKRNLYGEAIKAIKGIWFKTQAVISRPIEWTVKLKDKVKTLFATNHPMASESAERKRQHLQAEAPTWSSVNNCTEKILRPESEVINQKKKSRKSGLTPSFRARHAVVRPSSRRLR